MTGDFMRAGTPKWRGFNSDDATLERARVRQTTAMRYAAPVLFDQ